MTVSDRGSGMETAVAGPLWTSTIPGGVMIAAGMLALSDVVFTTIVSITLIGIAAVAAGAFEIMHAFLTTGRGSLVWRSLLGALYIAFGLILFVQPASGALVLTGLLAACLLGSGIVRAVLSFAYWQEGSLTMLISGVFALIAGSLILLAFPAISVWVLGFLLGVDLISHGFAWLLYAFRSDRELA